jgi:hypothetical protein
MLRAQSNSKVDNHHAQNKVKKKYSDYLEDALKTEMNSGTKGDSLQNCKSLEHSKNISRITSCFAINLLVLSLY